MVQKNPGISMNDLYTQLTNTDNDHTFSMEEFK